MLKECEDCFGVSCIIVREQKETICPCKECIIKVTCFNNVCEEFEILMGDIHNLRDPFYKFGGVGTLHEPKVRGV